MYAKKKKILSVVLLGHIDVTEKAPLGMLSFRSLSRAPLEDRGSHICQFI